MVRETSETNCRGVAHLGWSDKKYFGLRVQLFPHQRSVRDKRTGKHISLHTHTSVFTRATMPCEAFEKNSWGAAYLRWSGEQKLFSGSRPIIPSPKVPFVTKCQATISHYTRIRVLHVLLWSVRRLRRITGV